jgi:hypothetical protein
MTESQTSQSRALRLLKSIYDRTRDQTEPIFVETLAPDIGLTKEESQAAWRYLRDKGLIEIFNLRNWVTNSISSGARPIRRMDSEVRIHGENGVDDISAGTADAPGVGALAE